MHIPDGFLSDPVCAATTAVSIGAVAGAAVVIRRMAAVQPHAAMAMVAAGIFAGQMINFPVAEGTSGHLIGTALAVALLGPAAAMLIVAAVLVVQCLLFGDGGVHAIGANVLNMAAIAAVISQFVLVVAQRAGLGRLAAVATAAWCSVLAAALACALELAASGVQPLTVILPQMLKVHAVIGLGEAIVTVGVLAVLNSRALARISEPKIAHAGILLSAALLAPWASASPDGLERIARSLGFADLAATTYLAPFANYAAFEAGPEALSTLLACAIGLLTVFALVFALSRPRFGTPWRRTE